MGNIKENVKLKTPHCLYTVGKELLQDCYEGDMALVGELGTFDSGKKVIFADKDYYKNVLPDLSSKVMESFVYQNSRYAVVPYEKYVLDTLKSCRRDPASEWVNWNGHQYKGGMYKNTPHGKGHLRCSDGREYEGDFRMGYFHGDGIMKYIDGREYRGKFVNGMREGFGTLYMPSGEFFKGFFQNDNITENGTYFTKDGKPRKTGSVKVKSSGSTFWRKTINLWTGLGMFAACALLIWLLVTFLPDYSGPIRVGVFILPIVLVWQGMKQFFYFIKGLTD